MSRGGRIARAKANLLRQKIRISELTPEQVRKEIDVYLEQGNRDARKLYYLVNRGQAHLIVAEAGRAREGALIASLYARGSEAKMSIRLPLEKGYLTGVSEREMRSILSKMVDLWVKVLFQGSREAVESSQR
jgi:hypothetical protein